MATIATATTLSFLTSNKTKRFTTSPKVLLPQNVQRPPTALSATFSLPSFSTPSHFSGGNQLWAWNTLVSETFDRPSRPCSKFNVTACANRSGDHHATHHSHGIHGSAHKIPSGQDHELGISYREYHEVVVKVSSIEEKAQLARTHIWDNINKIENLKRQLKDQQHKIDSLCSELESAWKELDGAVTATVTELSAASSVKFNSPLGIDSHNQQKLPISADPVHGTRHMNYSNGRKRKHSEEQEDSEVPNKKGRWEDDEDLLGGLSGRDY